MGSLNQGRKQALDDKQVAKVRRLYHDSQMGTTALATRFGVSQTTIQHVILGKGSYGKYKNGTPAVDGGGNPVHPPVNSLHRRANHS